MPTYRAIVFDLDGTLSDSTTCGAMAMDQALEVEGLPPVGLAGTRRYVGLPLLEMIGLLCPPGTPGAQILRVTEGYRQIYPALAPTHERLFPGIPELLAALAGAGLRLAIATGKAQKGAEASSRRQGLDRHIPHIHGILPGRPGKPHPELLHRTLAALGVQPEEALMVGDTTFDLQMAAAAEVDACAVTWGAHDRATLRAAGPRHMVDELAELWDLLLDR